MNTRSGACRALSSRGAVAGRAESPHIATIYGLEEAQGSQFLAMELVEGATLAERLKAGPIPVGEALGIARQVADALQAALVKSEFCNLNAAVSPNGRWVAYNSNVSGRQEHYVEI